jgi:hypothetical protein
MLRCRGETDSWKKPEVEISCQTPFNLKFHNHVQITVVRIYYDLIRQT